MSTGKTKTLPDAGMILKLMLTRGELHGIGATTLDASRKDIQADVNLDRRFQPVMMDAPTRGNHSP